jgi:menaquinone-dependent protoporphyrinogen IX oxidase
MLWSELLERVTRLDKKLPGVLWNPQFITVFAGALFLSAFAKLRKVTIIFVMSACPSVRMEQLGSNCTDFH